MTDFIQWRQQHEKEKADYAQMVAFIAAFEVWLNDYLYGCKLTADFDKIDYSESDSVKSVQHVLENWHELKDKHRLENTNDR